MKRKEVEHRCADMIFGENDQIAIHAAPGTVE
jgi:hypothetical protein